MRTQQWRALLKHLRCTFPVDGIVHVRRYPSKNYQGSTRFDGRCYYVRIDSKQDYCSQVDSLLHEWAHVCLIEQAYKHEGAWGAMYAKIYSDNRGDNAIH